MIFRTLTVLCTLAMTLFVITVAGEGYAIDEKKLDETWDRIKKSPTSSRTGRHICPPPYSLIAGLCLYSPTYDITTYCTWEAARQHCLSYDGDLASFRHLKNLILVMGHMRATQRQERWVGGWRPNSSVEFEWVDGGSLPDTNSLLWDYIEDPNSNCLSLVSGRNFPKLKNLDCDKTSRCAMWCQFN
ncbi:C-type lectin domain-containing protein 180-like [Macrobrachium nipponense]|uniref:C-type lectin domain-containing protein 180-like n=1 Tax=Macrobrachium nipponense TaxID=159736 RepID=UPI0030C7CDB8